MEIARQTEVIIDNNVRGIIHCTAEGEVSWYDFARAIFEELSMEIEVVPCRTDEYPRPAPRPRYSSLENAKLKKAGLNRMRHYREALKDFLAEYGEKIKNEL